MICLVPIAPLGVVGESGTGKVNSELAFNRLLIVTGKYSSVIRVVIRSQEHLTFSAR